MDWIETFMSVTEGIRTPPMFRLWTGLTILAGVLQRRVYTYTKASTEPLCPNLFIVLVGPPASGKSLIINEARKLWSRVRGMNIASDNVTKASFVIELQNSVRTFRNGADEPTTFCAMVAPVAEFGVFITKYDMEFLNVLTHLFDNPEGYTEPRATVEDRTVDKPNFNMISGVTPDYMGDLFPDTAWGQGFTSRILFIYSDVVRFDNTNYFRRRNSAGDYELLLPELRKYFDIAGEFEWSPEAQSAHIAWLDAETPGAPEHSRLKHYASRRDVQIMKLAMLSSISAGNDLYITIEDYERAHEWLHEAELVMPDVFRAMAQKSDDQLITDLHQHIWPMWARKASEKRLPIDDEVLWAFLQKRTTSSNIQNVIHSAERSGVIRRAVSNSLRPKWIPRPLNERTPI